LVFAIWTIADRFSPSLVFLISAVSGALFNLALLLPDQSLYSLLILRFGTGFFLAGVYPVGMKIASDHFKEGLGLSLGYLVGALVVGTALPHLVRGLGWQLSFSTVVKVTSSLAAVGGIALWALVPDGPFRVPSSGFDPKAIARIFKNPGLTRAAFGYFGHMWELYAFWTFVPLAMLSIAPSEQPEMTSIWSFQVIALGGISCVLAGYISRIWGPGRTARWALLASGCCCLLSPLVLSAGQPLQILLFFSFWGMVVIADSPMFSTLVAAEAEDKTRGTSLTIVNCIGFSLTIASIQLLNLLVDVVSIQWIYLPLTVGPVIGLLTSKKWRIRRSRH
jgi:MFS family permease